jgi:c-di-GMP-binding flagellar brake protein YcgR
MAIDAPGCAQRAPAEGPGRLADGRHPEIETDETTMTAEDSKNTPEDLTPFQVRNRRDITRLFASLCSKGERLTLTDQTSGTLKQGFITEVDDEADYVVFRPDEKPTDDGESGAPLQINAGAEVDVEGALDHVKISFRSVVVELGSRNPEHLLLSMPDHVIRLQRREYYRVQVPSHPPVRCRIPGPGGNTQPFATLVKNLSSGGLMLLDSTCTFSGVTGTDYRECVLDLPGLDSITCTLRLCNMYDAKAGVPAEGKILGMQFVDLSTRSLSLVQRYAAKLEVGQRSLVGR